MSSVRPRIARFAAQGALQPTYKTVDCDIKEMAALLTKEAVEMRLTLVARPHQAALFRPDHTLTKGLNRKIN
jgi:hypothetical protein